MKIEKSISSNTLNESQLTEELYNWDELRNLVLQFERQLSATFTFRRPVRKITAELIFNDFIKLLSKDCYGKAYKRFDKCVRVFSVTEGFDPINGYSPKNIHIHSLFSTPAHMSVDGFKALIFINWMKASRLNGYDIKIDLCYDVNGIYDYINKEWSKPSVIDAINFNSNVLTHHIKN